MSEPMAPKILDSPEDQARARYMRNRQWETLERIAEHNPLWICWWDKNRRHAKHDRRPDDLIVHGLITGMELAQWLRSHQDWTVVGEWSDERYAAPVWITDTGRHALANREHYDMEPVLGGMVEPGWQCVPAEPASQ